jgi:hypothetical protein
MVHTNQDASKLAANNLKVLFKSPQKNKSRSVFVKKRGDAVFRFLPTN